MFDLNKKEAKKELDRLMPPFTVALIIGVLGSAYMQILKQDMVEGTGFVFFICVIVYLIFCFLYEHKHKAHNPEANLSVT